MHILYHEAEVVTSHVCFFFIFYTSPYSELWVLSCLPSLEFTFFGVVLCVVTH